MPEQMLARFLMLPELKMTYVIGKGTFSIIKCEKTSEFEVCPKCATPSTSVYDHRVIKIQDRPVAQLRTYLHIKKRRFKCPRCKSVFTEPVSGISKGKRTTERFREHVAQLCKHYHSLKDVRKHTGKSSRFVYQIYYERLELARRKRLYPWPKVIGIDEHRFARSKRGDFTEYATVIADHKGKRVYDICLGRQKDGLAYDLKQHHGRENVNWVTMDMSSAYRSFVKEYFPNAKIVADKFHVVRLLTNDLNRRRKQYVGDRRGNPIGKLLLKDAHRLDFFKRSVIEKWLADKPEIREIYMAKQALFRLYRTKGYNRAKHVIKRLLDYWGKSSLCNAPTKTTLFSG